MNDNRLILSMLICLVLVGCKSEAETKAEFMQFCTEHEFTSKQCEVLYVMNKDTRDAQSMSAGAMGMAAGSAGRSR